MARICIFAIHKPAFRSQYTITGPSRDTTATSEQIVAKLHTVLRNRPFLVVHDGPDTKCPVAAVSRLPSFSTYFEICLGDSAAKDVVWEKLHTTHPWGRKHTWGTMVPGENRGSPRRLHLVWTRTRKVIVDGMARRPLSTRNWKLTEVPPSEDEDGRRIGSGTSWTTLVGTEPILAVFTSSTELGKCGNLQVNVDHGRAFDLMLLTTCLSLYSAGLC
ncbi:hypothetical protein CCM_02552 [Cordyceps militaris CM01]|uniref:Uncharacterized protein n=1 Tax=Cordyceps militaris (strain CM01) TaxID=983644 RepID=G3JAG5_CORMM|nr:uncharacterized protein CCM_02552 [Cordyceps militaris CM01]EGX94281.1 hypothetical protein CCM_02552 [Cordyceps militaris CM01]